MAIKGHTDEEILRVPREAKSRSRARQSLKSAASTARQPVNRATLGHEHHRDPQDALRVRLRELAGSRVRYGYRRLTVMLKRGGWEVKAKRI